MCQCVARNDCTVEVANFVYNMDPGACIPAFRAGTISDTKALTRDVMSFSVELARPADFDAGQFVAMQVPGVPGYRGYSMVNFERSATRLDFVIKKKPGGGASEWLFNGGADGAATSTLFGPLGAATFYPNLGKNILCIAGGSGIAGMMSILVARAAGALFRSVQRLRVLRRAHVSATGSISPNCRSSRASSPTDCT